MEVIKIISLAQKEIDPVKEINNKVVDKIREKYPLNEELKMINLGIVDPQDADYLQYRQYVEDCITWGRQEKEKYNLI